VSQWIFLVFFGMLQVQAEIARGKPGDYSRQPITLTEKGQTSAWPSHTFATHASTSVVMEAKV